MRALPANRLWNFLFSVRGPLGFVALPEANTTSLSVGLSQKVFQDLTFDVAYSHSRIADQQIVVGPGNPEQPKFFTLIPGSSTRGSAARPATATSSRPRCATRSTRRLRR
jgi:hypothetical protein